ncbi:MAG: hypothetical protein V7K24_13325 [Nostoc sp.]
MGHGGGSVVLGFPQVEQLPSWGIARGGKGRRKTEMRKLGGAGGAGEAVEERITN